MPPNRRWQKATPIDSTSVPSGVEVSLLSTTTTGELTVLLREQNKAHTNTPNFGLVSTEVQKMNFKDTSSASYENQTRSALYTDMHVLSDQLDSLIGELELEHRGFLATMMKTGRLLKATEARLNNLLLTNSKADSFLYGAEEAFLTHEKVNFAATDAAVDVGFMTLGRAGRTPIDLHSVKFRADASSSKGAVQAVTVGGIDSLKSQDGSMWQLLCYTSFARGRVVARLELDLQAPTDVNALRVNMDPVSGNAIATATVMYSTDGVSWLRSDIVEEAVKIGVNQYDLGVSGVQKILILFSKDAADTTTDVIGQYVYIYSIDSIEILSGDYTNTLRSQAVLGPYYFLDELGGSVDFTRATLEACTVEPVDTSVAFFLSKDSETWYPVAHADNALAVVAFDSESNSASRSLLDSTLGANALLTQAASVDTVFAYDAVLNTYVNDDWSNRVVKRSIAVKRNVASTSSISGWVKTTAGYKTTLNVVLPEGLILNLGNSSAVINGNRVSGIVTVRQGYSTFETSDTNWIEIDETLNTASAVRAADALYPFNHKYLVEGYPYSNGFVGEKPYQGVGEYFGTLLQYVSPAEFNASVNRFNYGIYTIDDDTDELFFKIKVDKSDGTWKDELVLVSWSVTSTGDNGLYVKVDLASYSAKNTPRVDSFKVRVI